MIIITINTQSAHCQMQHNTWQGSIYSASSTAPKIITVSEWRTNVRWNCQHSIFLAEPLPTKELHKVLADLCLLSQASCTITSNQLLRLTNMLNTWTTLELQPIRLRILPRFFDFSGNLPVHSPSRFHIEKWKCHFGIRQVEFLGRTASSERVSPQTYKIQKFLIELRFR